jgi:5-methylthioadenosine/S-adenosylhomocysteine deaminase
MELVRMLTVEGARALGIGDEIGSLEAGKRADLILLDIEKPKFTPLTNIPAHIVNNAAPADVETVIVDGDVVMRDRNPVTMNVDEVRRQAEQAVDRFADETGWEMDIGGAEPPGTLDTVRDLPKRGPTRLLSRLALQSVRDTFEW